MKHEDERRGGQRGARRNHIAAGFLYMASSTCPLDRLGVRPRRPAARSITAPIGAIRPLGFNAIQRDQMIQPFPRPVVDGEIQLPDIQRLPMIRP